MQTWLLCSLRSKRNLFNHALIIAVRLARRRQHKSLSQFQLFQLQRYLYHCPQPSRYDWLEWSPL